MKTRLKMTTLWMLTILKTKWILLSHQSLEMIWLITKAPMKPSVSTCSLIYNVNTKHYFKLFQNCIALSWTLVLLLNTICWDLQSHKKNATGKCILFIEENGPDTLFVESSCKKHNMWYFSCMVTPFLCWRCLNLVVRVV